MLTLEEIKELKKGDEITYCYKGTFHHIDSSNWIHLESETGKIFFHGPDELVNMSLGEIATETSPPKHDPCRKFKKGDRAQVVERHGRNITCLPAGRIKVGDIVTVAENEAIEAFIKVLTEDGHKMMVPWFMLELVTPVEELEPYHILHNVANGYVIYKNEPKTDNIVVVFNKTHPNAKSAAEAEAARLNDEYRKEHENEN